jgi:hypothetical protein
MSATLGGGLGERVRALCAAACGEDVSPEAASASVPLVVSEGRSFPVEVSARAGADVAVDAAGPDHPRLLRPCWQKRAPSPCAHTGTAAQGLGCRRSCVSPFPAGALPHTRVRLYARRCATWAAPTARSGTGWSEAWRRRWSGRCARAGRAAGPAAMCWYSCRAWARSAP